MADIPHDRDATYSSQVAGDFRKWEGVIPADLTLPFCKERDYCN